MWRKSFGGVEDSKSFYYFARQRGAQQANASKTVLPFLGNRKGSYSFSVENKAVGNDGADVVLYSLLLGALRSLRLASGGSRTGNGCPRGYHPVTFFLE